jgi:hypothetical protein
MSDMQPTTRYDRITQGFKDHPVISLLVFLFVILSGASQLFGSPYDWYQRLTRDSLAAERAVAVRHVVDDLQRVREILPPDQLLNGCMEIKRRESFNQAYAYCESKSRVNRTNAGAILEGDIAKLEPFSQNQDIKEILRKLSKIQYLAYEMQNNYLVRARWKHDGCPNKVTFLLAATARSGALPRDARGRIRCVLSVQSDAEFLKRYGRTGDFISPLFRAYLKKKNVLVLIVPGQQSSLSRYFHDVNNRRYQTMLHEMEDLAPKLAAAMRT